MKIVSWLVDRLPARLWKAGNIYLSARLHFCIGRGPDGQRTARTVEWEGRTIAHGNQSRKSFHEPDAPPTPCA